MGNAECAKPLLVEQPFGLVERRRIDLRVPAFREVPQPVPAASADDRNLAMTFEERTPGMRQPDDPRRIT